MVHQKKNTGKSASALIRPINPKYELCQENIFSRNRHTYSLLTKLYVIPIVFNPEINMKFSDILQILGIVGAISMPFFNIPLILKIWRRRSSKDISLSWALGVWICIVLITPSALCSPDNVFRIFGIVNLVFFSGVMIAVLRYRRG